MGWEVENSRAIYDENRGGIAVDNTGYFVLRHLYEGRLPPKGVSDRVIHSPLIVGAYADFEFPSKIMKWLKEHYKRCPRGKESKRLVRTNHELGDLLRESAEQFILANPPRRKSIFEV